jgi:hypothetical protein
MSRSFLPGLRRRGVAIIGAGATALTVASLLAPTSTAFAAPQHAADASTVQRVAGATRLETAMAASLDQFPTVGSAQAVVLARSDNFPDALAGGPLAAKVGGPLLLTSSASLDTAVANEIKRVAPKGATVYILGGTKALSANVESAVTTLGDTPKRLQGSDRFGTAVAIADEMGDPTTVFEATGLNFPDALAGGPAAIKSGGVILLTNGNQQSTATAAYLSAHPGGTHYALGGPAAKADPSATPLVGDDRFWTSADIAMQFFPTTTIDGIATGYNFPDALAAGPDLAAKSAPLLLVSAGALPEAITTVMMGQSRTIATAIVFGGTQTVPDSVAAQVGALASATARAAAADTSAAYTGQFGVLSANLDLAVLVGNVTDVVDASSGDTTEYKHGSTTLTRAALYVPRAQLAALPLDDESLKAAVNTLFAQYDADSGITSTDPDTLFTLNAEQILLDPVAPASVRYATYAALVADDVLTFDTSGVKDSMGRVGIEVYAPLGTDAADQSKISFIFDPNTLLPLEDTVFDPSGKVITRTTVLSLTTAATAPADPYTS